MGKDELVGLEDWQTGCQEVQVVVWHICNSRSRSIRFEREISSLIHPSTFGMGVVSAFEHHVIVISQDGNVATGLMETREDFQDLATIGAAVNIIA